MILLCVYYNKIYAIVLFTVGTRRRASTGILVCRFLIIPKYFHVQNRMCVCACKVRV